MSAPPLDIAMLYDRYGAQVYGRCYRILGEEQSALDATQDVFLRALRNGEQFKGQASPMTWLYRIGTNICLNVLRAKAYRPQVCDDDGTGAVYDQGGKQEKATLELRSLVRSLLLKVDEPLRDVAIHYYFDGMTLEEIAKVLHISRPTVRKRLQLFLSLARKNMGPVEENEQPLEGILLLLALSLQGGFFL